MVTCPGNCCEDMRIGEGKTRADLEKNENWPEKDQVLEMLVEVPGRDDLFNCKNFDTTTRLCTIYETRPRMCRDFPYGKPCDRGCGYKQDPLTATLTSTQRWRESLGGK